MTIGCRFNFFRTSGDIGASWGRVFGNLQSVIKHQPWDNASAVKTGPGCFAYPDMLEVGNLDSFEEDRSHFGAWCIASAPLILGHDLANEDTNSKIWPIITNKAAIRVSQSFAEGAAMHPGGMVREWAAAAPPPPRRDRPRRRLPARRCICGRPRRKRPAGQCQLWARPAPYSTRAGCASALSRVGRAARRR